MQSLILKYMLFLLFVRNKVLYNIPHLIIHLWKYAIQIGDANCLLLASVWSAGRVEGVGPTLMTHTTPPGWRSKKARGGRGGPGGGSTPPPRLKKGLEKGKNHSEAKEEKKHCITKFVIIVGNKRRKLTAPVKKIVPSRDSHRHEIRANSIPLTYPVTCNMIIRKKN